MARNGDATEYSAASLRPRLGLSLCGGFVTAAALEAGIAEVLAETGVMHDLRYISATSAGSFIAVTLGTNRPERVQEMVEFVRKLTPKKVFKRRSMVRVGISHLLVIVAPRLRHRKLHINSFNEFQIVTEIMKAFDYDTINRELAVSPIEVEIIYTNLKTGETETCSSRILKEALAQGVEKDFAAASKQFQDAVFASASANVFYPPWRTQEDLWSDGALIRPDPLGFAYNAPVDRILHIGPNTVLHPTVEIVTIGDAIQKAFDIMERSFAVNEVRSADEKTHDVKELRALRRDLKRIVEHGVSDQETRDRLQKMIDDRFGAVGFSFREDRPLERIDIMPSWEPPVKISLYGGYTDFAQTVSAAIKRGRREMLRVLEREKLIVKNKE